MTHRIASLAALLVAALAGVGCGQNQTHPARDAYVPGDVMPLGCTPNLDGRIDANELAPTLGVPVSYLVTPAGTQSPVDVAGSVDTQGQRVWSFDEAAPADQLAMLKAADLAGQWFADSFPGGQFVTPLDAGGRTLGVYVHDDRGLWLLGYASAQMDPPEGRTLAVYDNPVELYRFPIMPGESYVSVGEVHEATVRGLPYAGRDTYEVNADATGKVVLPDVTFDQVHRVRTKVTIEPAAGVTTVTRQVSFLFECFGEVARATSQPGEMQDDFTVASEMRRLSLE